MAQKSSTCSHQSSGAGENAVRKIESSAKTCDCVLPKRFGCQVNSEGIAAPWVVGCVAHVLSQSQKRHNDHNVRFQLRMRECRGVLKQAGGAVDHGTVYGKMAKLDPGRATGTSLDRTDANGERSPHRCTTSEQWQRDVFTNPTGVPRNVRELAGTPMTETFPKGKRKKKWTGWKPARKRWRKEMTRCASILSCT